MSARRKEPTVQSPEQRLPIDRFNLDGFRGFPTPNEADARRQANPPQVPAAPTLQDKAVGLVHFAGLPLETAPIVRRILELEERVALLESEKSK